ncbi:MAG: hypothetical protein KDD24_08680, partial [Flavobacteriales bacterium]|nr:hypothetical protein [Flavobacteriales bacterium]
MKKSILFIALIICFMFSHNIISAQSVTSYTFAQAAGSPTLLTATYTTHTSGTTDYGVYTAVPLGFTFEYNCTNYTTISISNDGFIVMGNALSNSYTPLSSGTSNNVISVCAADLEGVAAGSSLRSKMTGTSPNRVFTVEWKNYGEYWDGGDFTFQIKLYETTNVIEMYWVTNTALSTASGFQVGLRGASNADFNNRTKANNTAWTSSAAGAANSDLMNCGTTVARGPGGLFTFTPPVGCAGAPTAGSAAASPSSITSCAALSTTLSVTGSSTGCGLTYQWQSAPAAGGPWTNISGATGITHVTSISANTYFRRVITCTASGSSANSASVLVTTTVSSPANDDPCNATLVTVNADLACGTVSAGTVSCAGNSGIAACAGSGADDDVWYKFVATSTVHNFDVLNVSGSVTDMVHEIFSGACGALSSVGCSDPNSSQFSGFTIGVTYYVRVYTYTSTGGQNTTFNLCIGTPPPPPSNDEPCGAIDLNVNIGSCAFQSADLGTTSTISTGMPAPGCSSLGPDVWFKVTVPAGGLIIDLSPNGGPTDFGMAWYTGPSCNNLTALVECD